MVVDRGIPAGFVLRSLRLVHRNCDRAAIVILDTPGQIAMFHLIAQRRALKLEGDGYRFKKSVLAHCKRTYNLSPILSRQGVIEELTRVIDEGPDAAARYIGTA